MLLAILQTDSRCSSSRQSSSSGQCTNPETESLDEINSSHENVHVGDPTNLKLTSLHHRHGWCKRQVAHKHPACLLRLRCIIRNGNVVCLRTLQYGHCKIPSPIQSFCQTFHGVHLATPAYRHSRTATFNNSKICKVPCSASFSLPAPFAPFALYQPPGARNTLLPESAQYLFRDFCWETFQGIPFMPTSTKASGRTVARTP